MATTSSANTPGSCGPPPEIANGFYRELQQHHYSVGETITYACRKFYELASDSDNRLVCSRHSTERVDWTGLMPECQLDALIVGSFSVGLLFLLLFIVMLGMYIRERQKNLAVKHLEKMADMQARRNSYTLPKETGIGGLPTRSELGLADDQTSTSYLSANDVDLSFPAPTSEQRLRRRMSDFTPIAPDTTRDRSYSIPSSWRSIPAGRAPGFGGSRQSAGSGNKTGAATAGDQPIPPIPASPSGSAVSHASSGNTYYLPDSASEVGKPRRVPVRMTTRYENYFNEAPLSASRRKPPPPSPISMTAGSAVGTECDFDNNFENSDL